MNRLDKYNSAIDALCQAHGVKHLYVFGSALTERFTAESDIDLLVDFDNVSVDTYADNYFDLKFSLEKILSRPVDLLEERAIKNPFFRQAVDQQKQLIYGH